MFSFFSKKKFLVDYLGGLTDMHCHILPGIDDGAKDNTASLTMLKEYESLGYKAIIATPHIMETYYNNTSSKIKENLKDFNLVKDKEGFGSISIEAASEYMLDTQFEKLTETKDLLSIVNNKVLVEMSYFQKPINVDTMLFNLQLKGFKSILAHPERYQYLKGVEEILYFKTKGSQLQLNLLSLGGHYGKESQKTALALLEKDQYDYVGTDAHHPGHFTVLKKITVNQKLERNIKNVMAKTKENLSA